MFDIGWQEIFVLAVLALIVIGPKDLPRAMRTITHWIRRMRSMAREFQDGLDTVVREAELDDLKREIDTASRVDVSGELEKVIDPTGSVRQELDMSGVQSDIEDAAHAVAPEVETDEGTMVPAAAAADGAEDAPTEDAPAEDAPAEEPAPVIYDAPAERPLADDSSVDEAPRAERAGGGG